MATRSSSTKRTRRSARSTKPTRSKRKAAPARPAPTDAPRVAADSRSASEKGLAQAHFELLAAQRRYEALVERVRVSSVRNARRSPVAAARALRSRRRWRILAEGDSWFRYTCGFGVIHHLTQRLRNAGRPLTIENLAASGATLEQILWPRSRATLIDALRARVGGRGWDAVLISAGGNDFADRRLFWRWLDPYDATQSAAEHVSSSFAEKMADLAIKYGELAELIAKHAPGTPMYVNVYDVPRPDGRAVGDDRRPLAGPWMEPGFIARGFPPERTEANVAFRIAVAGELLRAFRGMLVGLGSRYPHVRVVDTQGTLQPTKADWENELHPTDAGFDRIAEAFEQRLNADLPA